jgi:carbamoyltransferase
MQPALFFPSPYNSAAILTIDGVGEWCTASIGFGNGAGITIYKELFFPHSVGLLYSAFTYYLGFTVNSGEYKLMGLAPYGDPQSGQTKNFIETIKAHLVDIKEDGSIWLNQSCFSYATGLRMVNDKKWQALFGFPRRDPEADIEQQHCNLALAIQKITEEIILKMAAEAKRITGSENLCLAGGVALNCVANGKLVKEKIFKNIFIQPAAGDAGRCIGCCSCCRIYVLWGRENWFRWEK